MTVSSFIGSMQFPPQLFPLDISPIFPLSTLENTNFGNTHTVIPIEKLSAQPTAGINEFECTEIYFDYSAPTLCGDIVNYPFIMWPGETLESVNAQANAALTNISTNWDVNCLSDIKREVCARFYKPCVENVVAGNSSTYHMTEGRLLPYHKPCMSLCLQREQQCDRYHTYSFDCNAVDSNSLPYYANDSDTATNQHCNDFTWTPSDQYQHHQRHLRQQSSVLNDKLKSMHASTTSSSTGVIVANAKEPYIGSWCDEVIDVVYNKDPRIVSPYLPVLLPPFVLQSIQEYYLGLLESAIPPFYSKACLESQRKLLCGTTFLQPHRSELMESHYQVNEELYIPSYPNVELCESYMQECRDLVTLVPFLAHNCSQRQSLPINTIQMDDAMINLYPSSSQIVAFLPKPDNSNSSSGGSPVSLFSPPFYLNSSSLSLSVQCPYGFSPFDPLLNTKRNSVLIDGTACVMSCPFPAYTTPELDSMHSTVFYSSILSTILGLMQCVNMYNTPKAKIYSLIVIEILLSLAYCAFDCLPRMFVSNYNDFGCSSPSTWYTFQDTFIIGGVSSVKSTFADLCATHSLFVKFADFVFWWCGLAVFIELWLIVVWSLPSKSISYYRLYYYFGGALLALGNAVVVATYHDPVMIAPGSWSSICYWTTNDSTVDYWESFFPHSVCLVLSLFLALQVSLKCYFLWSNQKADSRPQLFEYWKSYRVLFLFAFLFLSVYGPLILWNATGIIWVDTPHMTKSVTDWALCLFSHFKGYDDLTYMEICGEHAEYRIPVIVWHYFFSLNIVENVVLFCISLNAESWKYWADILAKFSSGTPSQSLQSFHSSKVAPID